MKPVNKYGGELGILSPFVIKPFVLRILLIIIIFNLDGRSDLNFEYISK